MAHRKADRPPKLSLRERKLARNKLALLDSLVGMLDQRSLDEVRVKDLCQAAEVSAATFFNYFPQKTDVLVYFVQLWSLEMAWHAEQLGRRLGGLAAIEGIFALTAQRITEHPNLMAEIIAYQARMTSAPPLDGQISTAERRLRFPDLDGIDAVTAKTLEQVLAPLVERAVAAGELPARLRRGPLIEAIATIFFGLPVVLRLRDPGTLGSAYRRQLRLLWRGSRAGQE